MKGYWDPEVEPSVEDIMDIWRFSQFAFFSELVLWGDFPIQSSTWQVKPGQPAQATRMHTPIVCNTEYAQFVDNGWRRVPHTFMRDEGCSKFSLYPQ